MSFTFELHENTDLNKNFDSPEFDFKIRLYNYEIHNEEVIKLIFGSLYQRENDFIAEGSGHGQYIDDFKENYYGFAEPEIGKYFEKLSFNFKNPFYCCMAGKLREVKNKKPFYTRVELIRNLIKEFYSKGAAANLPWG